MKWQNYVDNVLSNNNRSLELQQAGSLLCIAKIGARALDIYERNETEMETEFAMEKGFYKCTHCEHIYPVLINVTYRYCPGCGYKIKEFKENG